MKRQLLPSLALVLGLGSMALAADPHVTPIPDGVESAPQDNGEGGRTCTILLRYDDGTDDMPGRGYTLGSQIQTLGIVATAPDDQTYRVESAGFFSEFWSTPGIVFFKATEVGNPSNTTKEPLFIDDGGIWEVDFSTPICVAAGADIELMLCPFGNTHGVTGEDNSAPDGRSFWAPFANCTAANPLPEDLMIWACVAPCGPVPTEEHSWGRIKSVYN